MVRKNLEFKRENVQKLKSKGKHADFLITLEHTDLIIEVKSMIGGMLDKYAMKPKHVAKMWNRFYGACTQCAHSKEEFKKNNKKVISIVLIADHITAEYLPFQHFASLSGLFDDLGIEEIEFISWNALEYLFHKTSVTEFERALIKKWSNPEAMSLGSIMSLDVDRDTPAHSYEYLKDVENEIFKDVG